MINEIVISKPAMTLLFNSTSKADGRFALAGILMREYKDYFVMVASDTHTLTEITYCKNPETVEVTKKGKLLKEKIIHHKILKTYLSDKLQKGQYYIKIDELFELDYVDGQFPRYESIFIDYKKATTVMTIDFAGLMRAFIPFYFDMGFLLNIKNYAESISCRLDIRSFVDDEYKPFGFENMESSDGFIKHTCFIKHTFMPIGTKGFDVKDLNLYKVKENGNA